MSERERWIVYPLLFFALGAALRDKMLHRVESKEIHCESLKIIDQHDPLGQAYVELSIERNNPTDPNQLVEQFGRLRIIDNQGKRVCQMDSGSLQLVSQPEQGKQAFAELTIKKSDPNDPIAMADEVGMLRLVDSEGRVVCGLAENAILQRVVSKRLDIVDADYRGRVVVATEQSPAMISPGGEPAVTTQGVIWLNNQRMNLKIAPPPSPKPAQNMPPNAAL